MVVKTMRKRIEQMAKGKFHRKKTEIKVSIQKIEEDVLGGKCTEGSFSIFSGNGKAVTGYCYSTNKKVEIVCEPSFSTREYEIQYQVHGEHSEDGTEERGKFIFLTDGGEIEVPFCFSIRSSQMVRDNSVLEIDTFFSVAQNRIEDALPYFCDRKYMEYLLKDKKEYLSVYRQLMNAENKTKSLEQFLIIFHKKKEVELKFEKNEIEVYEGNEEIEISLIQEEKRYIEGNIITNSQRIQLKETRLSNCKKIENTIYIPFTAKNIFYDNNVVDKIIISYGLKQINIPIKFIISEEQKRLRELFRLKQKEKKDVLYLYHSWFLYKIGQITKEEYDKRKECIERDIQGNHCPNPESDYMEFINNYFVNYSSREDKREKCYKYYENGVPSPFLYYEMIKDRNEDEELIEELNQVEIGALLWGTKYRYLSEILAQHTMNLIHKEKNYCDTLKRIAERIYTQYPTRENLLVLCSYLMKGCKIENKYHKYYDYAIGSYIKLLGIYEYFIRSLGEDYKKKIPRSVLLYCLDNQNLSEIEQEHLYYNLFLYENEYDTMLYHYSTKIQDFLRNQMEKGRINNNLFYLYSRNLTRILQKDEMLKVFPNILFQHKITCYNPNIIGVYVYHKETKEGVYTPLQNGIGYIEIFTKQYSLSFINLVGEHYIEGVSYELERLFSVEKYSLSCYQLNQEHQFLAYYLLSQELEKNEIIISIAKKVLEYETISEEFYWELLEKIVRFYEQECDKEMLQYYLSKLNLSFYNKEKRIYFSSQMIQNELYKFAVDNIKKYSYIGIQNEYLEKLICYLEDNGQEEELLYDICNFCFEQGILGEYSLKHLVNTSIRPLNEMIQLWNISVKQKNCLPQLEENIVMLSLFEQNFLEEVCNIFLAYYERNGKDIISIAFIRYLLIYRLLEQRIISDNLYEISRTLLLEEHIDDLETKLAFLYQVEQRLGDIPIEIVDNICGVPVGWIERQMLELEFYGMSMNFFQNFVPYISKNYSFGQYIEYFGEDNNKYMIEYTFVSENKKKTEKWKMREILSGLFLSKYVLFYGEEIHYIIWKCSEKEERQKVKTGVISYCDKDNKLKNEYEVLNNIIKNIQSNTEKSKLKDDMKDYLKKKLLFKKSWSLLE